MAFETEDHETQYCFPDINSSCIKEKRFKYEYNIMYVFVSLLSAWTVCLNLLVIISISHFKKLHTPSNLLILSLAVADMLTGLIVIPLEGIKQIETCWYFGDTVCGLFVITLGLLLDASLGNFVLIAVDRYVAVCHPLQYPHKITTTKTLVSIFICWFCCSVHISGYVISNGFFTISDKTPCYGQCNFMTSPAWRIINLISFFIIPCVVIITVYLRIFYIVQQQVKAINSLMKGGKCVVEGSVKMKSERKAALTLGVIVSVYLLCWIPFYICSLTEATKITYTTMTFLMWTLYISCGLNPLVYALFYNWFQISVKHIITLKIFHPESSQIEISK